MTVALSGSTLIVFGVAEAAPCATNVRDGSDAPSLVSSHPTYVSASVKHALAVVRALRRLDCAALSFALFLAPRKVGRAMAIRMPMMRTTTMSSMRVKPAASCLRSMRRLNIFVSPPLDVAAFTELNFGIGRGPLSRPAGGFLGRSLPRSFVPTRDISASDTDQPTPGTAKAGHEARPTHG